MAGPKIVMFNARFQIVGIILHNRLRWKGVDTLKWDELYPLYAQEHPAPNSLKLPYFTTEIHSHLGARQHPLIL